MAQSGFKTLSYFHKRHCVKIVRIQSFSGPYFPAFGLRVSPYSVRMRENTDLKNSEYGHFSHSDVVSQTFDRVPKDTSEGYTMNWFCVKYLTKILSGSTVQATKYGEVSLRKKPKFDLISWHLISWCGNFVERHSFRKASGESPETLRKLCLSTKFPHQEIR